MCAAIIYITYKGDLCMKKLTGLVMALIVSVCLVFTSSFEAKAAGSYKTFDFSQMTLELQRGTEYSVSGTQLNVIFSGLWKEIQFKLPEVIDISECPSVTFNGNCTSGKTCFKLYNTDNEEVAVQYDFKSNGDCTFSTDTTKTNTKVDHIGIMSKESNTFSVTINSVKFKTTVIDWDNVPIDASRNLLTTYGEAFDTVGCAVNYAKFSKSEIVNYIKKEHNSITPGNEMKPDAIMNEDATISVEEAKELGYYIPEGYTESTVPKLNFTTVDDMLKIASDNGLKVRAHTLVWHQQTPDRFFREGYSANGAYVSKDVMTKRMEFYIKTVMDHVYSGQYGNIIYAWDVVNEYLHANNSGWLNIFGGVNTNPDFVKTAFKYAYEELEKYGVQDKVKLFYNDYNTYEKKNDIITLINNINADKKVCAGIGMQSHLDTGYPTASTFKSTLQAFINAGFEVQITELDVTCSNLDTQAKYYYNLMSGIMDVKKTSDADENVGKITALIFWGLADDDSWRSAKNPLLYSDCATPKAAYEQVLKAYEDSGYVPPVTLGDINGDKVVDITDYTTLRRYINGQGIEINEKNADINKDGVVDFFDLVALKSLI